VILPDSETVVDVLCSCERNDLRANPPDTMPPPVQLSIRILSCVCEIQALDQLVLRDGIPSSLYCLKLATWPSLPETLAGHGGLWSAQQRTDLLSHVPAGWRHASPAGERCTTKWLQKLR